MRQLADRPWVNWLMLAAWTGFIWFLSSRPSVPSAASDIADYVVRQGGHLALHFILFLLAWRAGVARWGRRWGSMFALVFALANGVMDELYQLTVPGRSANLEDVLTNTAGVLLAYGVVHFGKVGNRTQ